MRRWFLIPVIYYLGSACTAFSITVSANQTLLLNIGTFYALNVTPASINLTINDSSWSINNGVLTSDSSVGVVSPVGNITFATNSPTNAAHTVSVTVSNGVGSSLASIWPSNLNFFIIPSSMAPGSSTGSIVPSTVEFTLQNITTSQILFSFNGAATVLGNGYPMAYKVTSGAVIPAQTVTFTVTFTLSKN